MEITKEMVDKAMSEAVNSLKKTLIDEMQSTITWGAKEKAVGVVSDFITIWIKENILPDLGAWLSQNKESLLQIGKDLAPAMNKLLVDAMVEKLKENLSESSYHRSAIFKALFD